MYIILGVYHKIDIFKRGHVTLDNRKEHLLRFVKLGMDFYRAAILAQCTEDEIEVLRNDTQFQKKLELHDALLEMQLLEKLDFAMEVAKMKGNSAGIRWKLEKVNPTKWGKKDEEKPPFEGEFHVYLEGKGVDDTESGDS